MTRRVRVIRYHVQPELVVDDGENLAPLPVAPIVIPAAEWQSFTDGGLPAALAQLQAQIDQQDAEFDSGIQEKP